MCDIYEETTRTIKKHLSSRNLQKTEPNWQIAKSKVGGRGVFAKKDIETGEIIFVDYPLILGPRAIKEKICAVCYNVENLAKCPKSCGLYVCSEECKESKTHRLDCEKIRSWKGEEDLEGIEVCLCPIRGLFLKDFEKETVKILIGHKDDVHVKEVDFLKDKFKLHLEPEEEDFMRTVSSVLDANAFEVATGTSRSLRGLYPLSSLLNHNCSPNVMHVFDKGRNMIVKASKPIKTGQEIYNSYSRTIWATLSRRLHLLTTKQFACACPRCKDPTEFNTKLNSAFCKGCRGIALPKNPLRFNTEWVCLDCGAVQGEGEVRFVLSVLASKLSELTVENFHDSIEFFKKKVLEIVPEFSQASVGFKYAVIWFLGYNQGFMLNEISDEYLSLREDFCRDILVLVHKLRLGDCKIKGLILNELHKTLEEKTARKNQLNSQIEINNNVLEEDEILEECAKIFLFDVAAPKDLQQFWQTRKIDTDWRNYF